MTKIIVGLGNKGNSYINTYHNTGFRAVDMMADILHAKFNKEIADNDIAEVKTSAGKVVLAKPVTFMNLSGQAVVKLARHYKVLPKDILVISDDIDLAKGNFRYRTEGSGGTHNGLKNCVAMLKTEEFPRLRIGIGRPENVELADYVLSHVDKSSRELIDVATKQGLATIMKEFLLND